jgi:hypothetical protein
MHTAVTSARFSCMYLCLQASRGCFVASPPSQVPTSFTMDKLHAVTRRQLSQGPCPSEWSAEEAYYRTGVYSSAVSYVASMHGGARRALPLFAADISTAASRSRRNAGECTKHQNSHGALSPGVLVCWIYGTLFDWHLNMHDNLTCFFLCTETMLHAEGYLLHSSSMHAPGDVHSIRMTCKHVCSTRIRFAGCLVLTVSLCSGMVIDDRCRISGNSVRVAVLLFP